MNPETSRSRIAEALNSGDNWKRPYHVVLSEIPNLKISDFQQRAAEVIDPNGTQNRESEAFLGLQADLVQGYVDQLYTYLPDLAVKLDKELNPEVK